MKRLPKLDLSRFMFTREDFWTKLTGIKTFEATEGTEIGELPDGRAIMVLMDEQVRRFRIFFCVNRVTIEETSVAMPSNEKRREALVKYVQLTKALQGIARRNRNEG